MKIDNMKYLAIDPGNSTGWAGFDANGDLVGCSKIKGHDNFLDWLEEQSPEKIVLENYKVGRGGGSQFASSFSDVPTLQLIGAIKRIARKRCIAILEQTPNEMYMGLRYLGMWEKYRGAGKKTHIPDEQSALAHGVYYLTRHGIRKHRLDKRDN